MPPPTNPFSDLTTRADVARLLGTSSAQLVYLLHVRPEEQRYAEFRVPKRRGGERAIYSPKPDLKHLQRKLAERLAEIYRPRSVVHGFVPERSIATNADRHLGRRFVLNVDLKDFFPTIHFGRVRGLFASPAIGASGQAALVLAQICCHKAALPPGAPTSPILANMVCAKLDRELMALAKKHHCRYTRYADDLTFSKQRHSFPREVAYFGTSQAAVVGEELRAVIESNGFAVHPDKVRLFRNTYRQCVTGLVVNEKRNVPRRFVRQLRAMIHAWEKFGLAQAEGEYNLRYWRGAATATPPPFGLVVRGKLEFVKMIRGVGDPVYRHLQQRLVRADPAYLGVMEEENRQMTRRDVFISHASEDKKAFVRPFAQELIKAGVTVWYDEFEIQVGDSIRQKVDEGLARARFGLVVLSPNFFAVGKMWPQRELDGLVSGEDASGSRRILPVWYNIGFKEVQKKSPMLAGVLALDASKESLESMAAKVSAKLKSAK